MSTTPHDALFKHTFSQPQHAIELFRSLLPAAVVQHIDFDTLRGEPASFIDDKLRARFSDLLFRVRLAGQPAYLYLLSPSSGAGSSAASRPRASMPCSQTSSQRPRTTATPGCCRGRLIYPPISGAARPGSLYPGPG
jgi:hypothetical protein